MLQQALIDDVLLHVGRLTDSERSRGRQNLTIRRLPLLVPQILREDLERLLAAAIEACAPVRPRRNRRLAHLDLESVITNAMPSGMSRTQVEEAIASLDAILHRLEIHYWDSTTMYTDVIVQGGDADALVYYLVTGIRAEERRFQRLRSGQALPEDYERESLP